MGSHGMNSFPDNGLPRINLVYTLKLISTTQAPKLPKLCFKS
uniref:Uncharacterized protein n=1 Tax=Setaria italica TaxID=4555 RepID=K3ZGV7_SETIT